MTYSDLKRRTLGHLGLASTSTVIPATDLGEAVNTAVSETWR
jgi:hypothetical protein